MVSLCELRSLLVDGPWSDLIALLLSHCLITAEIEERNIFPKYVSGSVSSSSSSSGLGKRAPETKFFDYFQGFN